VLETKMREIVGLGESVWRVASEESKASNILEDQFKRIFIKSGAAGFVN
jgi:hypothetical protein